MTPSTDDSFDIAKWAGGLLVGGVLAAYRFFGGGERKALRKSLESFEKKLEEFGEDLRGIRVSVENARMDVGNLRSHVDRHIDADEDFQRRILYPGNGR